MQKVVGSSPIIRLKQGPVNRGFLLPAAAALRPSRKRFCKRAAMLHNPQVARDESTPTGLAEAIWGSSQAHSRSWGSRQVRRVARDLFPSDAPGQGHDWNLTPEQAADSGQ